MFFCTPLFQLCLKAFNKRSQLELQLTMDSHARSRILNDGDRTSIQYNLYCVFSSNTLVITVPIYTA